MSRQGGRRTAGRHTSSPGRFLTTGLTSTASTSVPGGQHHDGLVVRQQLQPGRSAQKALRRQGRRCLRAQRHAQRELLVEVKPCSRQRRPSHTQLSLLMSGRCPSNPDSDPALSASHLLSRRVSARRWTTQRRLTQLPSRTRKAMAKQALPRSFRPGTTSSRWRMSTTWAFATPPSSVGTPGNRRQARSSICVGLRRPVTSGHPMVGPHAAPALVSVRGQCRLGKREAGTRGSDTPETRRL